MDLDKRRVMFATPGRDAETVKAFAADLAAHGGTPKTQVERVCCDMSPAFVKGIGLHLSEQPDTEAAEQGPGAAIPAEATEPVSATVAVQSEPGGDVPARQPGFTGRRSSLTGLTLQPKPMRRSAKYGEPRQRPAPNSSGAATPG